MNASHCRVSSIRPSASAAKLNTAKAGVKHQRTQGSERASQASGRTRGNLKKR